MEKLLAILAEATDEQRVRILPNHLGASTEFVIKHVPTGISPRGVLVDGDGRSAFVVNALDDSITVIDIETLEPAETIDLGGPDTITQVRRGERLFHSADIAFQRQFSCHSCHPDGHVDGITYDVEEGETLYVPPMWWHHVVNVGDNLALTENLIEPPNREEGLGVLRDLLELETALERADLERAAKGGTPPEVCRAATEPGARGACTPLRFRDALPRSKTDFALLAACLRAVDP